MKHLKQATVYRAELPHVSELEPYLAAKQFTDILPEQVSTAGFVAVPGTGGQFVASFESGMAFAIRCDEKAIPASAVAAEVEKRCVAIQCNEGRTPGKKERRDLKEQVFAEFTRRALVKSAVITCFHDTQRRYLYVPSTSDKITGMVGGLLVNALSTIKTEPINVCDVTMGLTKRMKDWLNDEDEPFGAAFDLGHSASLERVTYDGKESIRHALAASDMSMVRSGLSEAFMRGFDVRELGLTHGGASFRLTHDFRLKGIAYDYSVPDFDDEVDAWEQTAAIEVLELRSIMDALVEMLGTRPLAGVAA